MADHKRPSLTVLGGPLAGTRFVLDEGAQSISVGSDPSSDFRLVLPGVSPLHARLVIDATGVTIHDVGSVRGVHVNDSRVSEPVPLRNGDIVWLGTPGEADVVMLQCILPRAPAQPPAPPPIPLPPPEHSAESETLALGPEALAAPEALVAPETHGESPFLEVGPEVEASSHAESAEPAASPTEPEFLAEESAGATSPEEPARFEPDSIPEPAAYPATFFEDETAETLVEAPPAAAPEENEPTLLMEATEVTPEVEPTVELNGAPLEPTMALNPAHEALGEATLPAIPRPAPPPHVEVEAPARAPRPPSAPHAPRPSAPPASSTPTPRVSPTAKPIALKKEAPPSPRPRPHPAGSPAAPAVPARGKASSRTGLYAALGLGVVAVVGGGLFVARRFLPVPGQSPGVVQTPSPASQIPNPTLPPLPPPPTTVAVEPTPRPTVEEAITIVKPTPPPTLATPAPPTPSASPKKAGPTPGPAATATGPSADALRAQQTAAQVASLQAQADSALASRQYDAAIGALDDVLRLDPGNAKAAGDRTNAIALRDAARKKFVPGRTVVKTEKAQDGLAGFDGAAVQKAPDFLGRIEFEMNPASGIRPNDNYSLKFYLVNDGKKAIRVGAISVTTAVNGTGSGAPFASKVRDVEPQQRALLGEVSASWKDGTTSWSTEVLVTANKGDSLKNQITWR
ncbi:MAG TPA: FHA domain-containing protein [Vicinamibacteria bacterium]|jgi:hypothetical protein|nr:FHA domain-containing protein [Vicinamibacteria bacterium]